MKHRPRLQEEAEKIQVTFNRTQLDLIDKFRGIFGNTRAEIVRSIVANWIFEKNGKKDENYGHIKKHEE